MDRTTKYWEPCNGCPDGHSSFWKTVIESPQWKAWHAKQRKTGGVYDVAECQETGTISQKHFQEFLEFTKK